MMKHFLAFGLCILLIQESVAPPVTNKENEQNISQNEYEVNNIDQLTYEKYLKEVVDALEKDSAFKEILKNSNSEEIRNGKIADKLQLVSHDVRTLLHEVKRREVNRLSHLASLKTKRESDHKDMTAHLDHNNLETFEPIDLKKLISQTAKDLNRIDQKRQEQFKEYEMEKKLKKEQKLKEMDEASRKKYEEEIRRSEEMYKKHKPLHYPGRKEQLEEVWEKQDHMESQPFDPKVFFHMHDLDNNHYWDEFEVKTLFRLEIDKLRQEGYGQEHLLEISEEMERMRERLFNESDINRDHLISYQEFLDQINRPEFREDPGWKTINEQQIYSEQEYEAFQRQRQEENQRKMANGIPPPNLDHNGYPQQYPPHYASHEMTGHQVPYGQPLPEYKPYPGQVPPHQMQGHQQVPLQHHGQVPEYEIHGHVPQQQFHGQPYQQQFQGQPHQDQFQGQPHQQQFQGQPHQQFQGQPAQQQYQGQAQQQFQGQPTQQQFQGQPAQQQVQGQPTQQQFQGQPTQQQFQGQPAQQQPSQQVPSQVNQQQAQQNPPIAKEAGNAPVSNSIPEVKMA